MELTPEQFQYLEQKKNDIQSGLIKHNPAEIAEISNKLDQILNQISPRRYHDNLPNNSRHSRSPSANKKRVSKQHDNQGKELSQKEDFLGTPQKTADTTFNKSYTHHNQPSPFSKSGFGDVTEDDQINFAEDKIPNNSASLYPKFRKSSSNSNKKIKRPRIESDHQAKPSFQLLKTQDYEYSQTHSTAKL